MWNSFWQEISSTMMVRLVEAALYTSLAPPGTKACDAGGGAFRPEWREGPVRTRCSSAISCGPDATSMS
jgi:hypothetical protein